MQDKIQELTDLFDETKQAHLEAFSDTDGYDPEWPIWYVDYLLDRLPPLLEANLSRSKLIYLLVHLSKIQPSEAPGASWARYYARYLAERYM